MFLKDNTFIAFLCVMLCFPKQIYAYQEKKTIYQPYFKDAPCAHGTHVICNEISSKPLEVVLQTRNHQNVEKNQEWKVLRRNNDVVSLAMLKYGRNEKKMTFCVLVVTNDKSCFGASLFSLGEPLHKIWSLRRSS